MAAAEQLSIPIQIIVAGIAALPLLVSPFVAWLLSRSRVSKDAAAIDYLNKRLDILERLNKVHDQFTEGPMKSLLEAEVERGRTFLLQPLTYAAHGEEVGALPLFDRFFLTEPAKTVRKRVYKGLFYFFFGIAVLGIPYGVFALTTGTESDPAILLGFLFYLGIALLCRRAAR